MPAEVKILVEGFTNADFVGEGGEERTQPTITLVRDGDLIMVVDPGIMESQQILIDALQEEDLTVEDVNYVCVTHSHFDHYRNVGMFPNAKTLEYGGLWGGDTIENWAEDFTPNIKVMHTPGHDYTGLTLFVTTEDGVVAICGDVFWKENYPENDGYASDPVKLEESRQMVFKMSDWIIPGHGPKYKTKKDQTEEFKDQFPAVKEKESKNILTCKKCHRSMNRQDRCLCRPWLCHNCCECGLDCDLCGCSHKK